MYTVCVYVSVCVCVCPLGFGLITALPSLASENSNAALSTNSFSDQTLDLGPISLSTSQSGEILFTCCRWHNNISKRESTCSPSSQPRWQSGKKALEPGVKIKHQCTKVLPSTDYLISDINRRKMDWPAVWTYRWYGCCPEGQLPVRPSLRSSQPPDL